MEAENSIDVASRPATPAVGQEKSNKKPAAVAAPEQHDLFACARRRKLPDERKSITHKFSVGGHEGYIIVGMYEGAAPGEIFIKMAKEGSTLSGFLDGVALSISIGLQYGVPLKVLVDKLTNTHFEPLGFTENPSIRYASSVLNDIACWLGGKFLSLEYLKSEGHPDRSGSGPAADERSNCEYARPRVIQPNNSGGTTGDAPSCPTCGMLMAPNGSCYKCVNCGSTRGCS